MCISGRIDKEEDNSLQWENLNLKFTICSHKLLLPTRGNIFLNVVLFSFCTKFIFVLIYRNSCMWLCTFIYVHEWRSEDKHRFCSSGTVHLVLLRQFPFSLGLMNWDWLTGTQMPQISACLEITRVGTGMPGFSMLLLGKHISSCLCTLPFHQWRYLLNPIFNSLRKGTNYGT